LVYATLLTSDFLEVLMESIKTIVVASIDPNEKVGPAGSGTQHLVAIDQTLPYEIFFENMSGASAPAQEVVVTDYLDANLDWTSFELTEITWGDQTVIIPQNSMDFSTRLTVPDYRPGVTKSWWVDILVEISTLTGRVRWTLTCLDPDTGLPPEDPLAGFLPPNDASGRGEGHVAFTIQPRADLSLGATITNTAYIVFDSNAVIQTNQVWNTIGTYGQNLYLPLIRK
jgi:uncharacterized repeat protein (TIGR01451 family)